MNDIVILEDAIETPETSAVEVGEAASTEETPEPEDGQLTGQVETETGESEAEPVTEEITGTGEQSGTVIITEQAGTEYIAMTAEPRPFLTTPFEEYTVTEGYLLMFFMMAVIAAIYSMIRRFTI